MPPLERCLPSYPSHDFEPLRYGLGAWTEHIFFAYDLVAQLRPEVFVELGTDRGESYFAFCQSVCENQTGTRCFAVDHWLGDSHAGSYDEATYQDVSEHNRVHYAAFSTLLRSSFDDALSRFARESVDLLHVDGHHTEEAARHDVESWLPKLRPGGILLLHDVAVRGRGFGVWKVWEELATRGRSFTFATPPGLGVWEKPPARAQSALLETLLGHPERSGAESRDPAEFLGSDRTGAGSLTATPRDPSTALRSAPDDRDGLRFYYRQRHGALQEMMARQWRDGSVRRAPMASETVLQVFWSTDGNFSETQSVDARIGHGSWKEVVIPLPADEPVRHLRIDFFSALTVVEIAEIAADGRGLKLDELSLGGDCVRLSAEPFRLQVTGMDPQLYPPVFSPPLPREGLSVQMRLRVDAT
ncbi:MAG: class I SAM-dependent methyltransferase [Chthoniobacterales bacterium]